MTGSKRKLPLWATIFTITGVLILCTIGTWQIQRLAWKKDIIAKLDSAYKTPLYDPDLNTFKEAQFAYTQIPGELLFDKSFLYGHAVQNEQQGKFLIIPMRTNHGTVLVNVGFIEQENTASAQNPVLFFRNRNVTVNGIVRKPSWNSFTPKNKPKDNIWYRLDVNQIAETKNLPNPIPFILYADSIRKKFSDTLPNNTRWEPNNNHAQYAFFWFTLAGALIIIYILRFLKSEKKS